MKTYEIIIKGDDNFISSQKVTAIDFKDAVKKAKQSAKHCAVLTNEQLRIVCVSEL